MMIIQLMQPFYRGREIPVCSILPPPVIVLPRLPFSHT